MISALYRDLRKSLEDSKDEPGAADFYYGEMEMRRLDPESPWAERRILDAYRIVSGYGLRASRAFISLVVTILLFAFLFNATHAFVCGAGSCGKPYIESVLFSTESTTSLLRAPEQSLTHVGEALAIALRLVGPLFFGLMILSLRGRVKR